MRELVEPLAEIEFETGDDKDGEKCPNPNFVDLTEEKPQKQFDLFDPDNYDDMCEIIFDSLTIVKVGDNQELVCSHQVREERLKERGKLSE